MEFKIQFNLNEKIFLRDPQETKLGQRIIQYGIICIHELGFESFTFKKLSERIESTEASIYRYFENKHKLLVYLSSWYWEWLSFQINFQTNHLVNPREKLSAILRVISTAGQENKNITFVNESKLHEIMITEGVKVFHIKDVDKENEDGLYKHFKNLSTQVADVIKEINPDYEYANSLATILIETAFNHIYYVDHLSTLTSIQSKDPTEINQLLSHICDKILQ